MAVTEAGAEVEVPVVLGFTPPSVAIPDEDHPGLFRAGVRGGPYSDETNEQHRCPATDLSAPGAVAPVNCTADFFESGRSVSVTNDPCVASNVCTVVRGTVPPSVLFFVPNLGAAFCWNDAV